MRCLSARGLIFLALSSLASAQSFEPRLRNADLKKQVDAQSYRTLPCTETSCFAIDGHLFYRTTSPEAFLYYHGGYWFDGFIELNPSKSLSFNSRLAVFHPAASYGVVSTAKILPFLAITWSENLTRYHLGNIDARIRWLDLDQQTLGAGLSLEDKDMAGLFLEFAGGVSRLRFVLDGTGGYMVARDLWYAQLDFWEERIGVYTFSLNSFSSPHAFGAFSKLPLGNGLRLDSELSARQSAWAALGRIHQNSSWGPLTLRTSVQARYYGSGYASDIKGQIDHDYIPISYENRSYLISENIFSFGDDVLATGARIQLGLELSKLWRIGLDLESTRFDFMSIEDVERIFYRSDLSFCPSEHGCGSFFVSNRALTSVNDPIKNRPLLSSDRHYGLDARVSF
jgi:hypothetical protein